MFALSTSNDDSSFWKKCSFGSKMFSIKKLPISKVESFLKSYFWPKSNMQNSAYTKLLNLEL